MSIWIDSQLFKMLREQLHLTQQGLADESTVSIATIKRIESAPSSYKCRNNEADKLARTLKVELEDLRDVGAGKLFDIGGQVEANLANGMSIEEATAGAVALVHMVARKLERQNRRK